MDKKRIIQRTAEYVKEQLEGEGTGHDWWHVYRVWKTAAKIGEKENADLFVVELAALLHDIGDFKFHNGDTSVGPRMAEAWLRKMEVGEPVINHTCEIVRDVSYKGAGTPTPMRTIEGKAVQDADRLDAVGAIGIARTFAYGGAKGREIYNPDVKPENHQTFDQYKNGTGPTINHFYEKLLLLKDRMNTETARKIAQKRHNFMETFLETFYAEWNQSDL